MTYGPSSGKHEILQKWKMKIFIVLVGKNKKRPVAGAPLRTINLLRKNWISAGELYQLCEEAPQLPDNRQRKGHLSRWPFDTNFALSPTHEHRRQCHIYGWWTRLSARRSVFSGF
ncbi:hypothetical protein C7R96_10165 [Escherichia coli]|nr:hypothetical protein C7R96_10165 [Escherichia coli]TFX92955.1 hypothetical protein DEN95_02960 [Escherichia coli]TIZ57909.1 hypothetical protein C9327_22565 [Escherichia coli]TJB53215.1 hypothetical protein C9287_23240 [Escherichia coli]TJI28216.1 hypothetical protein C9140_20545 [Escherichia coli]